MTTIEPTEVDQVRAALSDSAYLPVPVLTRDKRPSGFAWTVRARKGEVQPASGGALNTGVLCDGLRVIDIDIDDDAVATYVAEIARRLFGDAPERYRDNSSRRTLVYRAANGEPGKRKIVGGQGSIEVLGYGQQFVAFGLHPSGAELRWRGEPLHQVHRYDLVAVSEEQIDEFLTLVAPSFGADPPGPYGGDAVGANLHQHSVIPIPSTTRPDDARAAAYVDAAVREEVEAVQSAPKGQRNHQLNVSAFALGQFVGAGLIGEQEVRGLLENAALGLAHDDGPASVQKTIRSGLKSGMQQPRLIPEAEPVTLVSAEDYAVSANLKVNGVLAVIPTVLDELDDNEEAGACGGAIDYFDAPDSMLQVGGVVGELANWISETAAEPIRIHAVGAALVTVGALLGRKAFTLSRQVGTAVYVGVLTPSGVGKQHPIDCLRMALDAGQGGPKAVNSLHVGWQSSMPMLLKTLADQATRVVIADEFADKLAGLNSKNASLSQTALSEALRSLWGVTHSSFSPDGSISSQARGVPDNLIRPSLSFFGASTGKDFARSLISKDVTNGLFNRFLILPRYGEVQSRPERDDALQLPAALKERLQWLHDCLPPMQMTLAQRGDGYPQPILVPFSDAAREAHEANRVTGKAMVRESERDDAMTLYGRYAEQIKRIALIVACGRSPEDLSRALIEVSDMEFARKLVDFSLGQFVLMVRREMVENWIEANRKKVLDVIRHAGIARRSELLRKVRAVKGREIDEIITLLKGAECIEEIKIATAGRTATAYRYLRD